MPLTCLTSLASWRAYSGIRSGPITKTATSKRMMNSEPLMSNMCGLVAPALVMECQWPSVGRLQGHPDSSLRAPSPHGQLNRIADRPGTDGDDELCLLYTSPSPR